MARELDKASLLRLASAAERVANAAYAEEGLHAVVQATWDVFRPQTVAVILFDEETERLSIKTSRGLSAGFISHFSRPLGTGVAAEVALGGMALLIGKASPETEEYRDVKLEHDFGCAIAVQLTVNHRPIGYLYCDHRQADYFSRADFHALRCLGHLASLAVEKAHLHDEVARLTVDDPQTGLETYSYFYKRLSYEIERAVRYGGSVGLILFEVVNLPYVEDVYGRAGTTEAVRHISRIIQVHTRGVDFAARFRSNQIMVCLVHAQEEVLKVVADRINAAAKGAPFACPAQRAGGAAEEGEGSRRMCVELCGGGAVAPGQAREAPALVSKAQKALLAARRLGCGHIAVAQE